jgi:hypothetical protein
MKLHLVYIVALIENAHGEFALVVVALIENAHGEFALG